MATRGLVGPQNYPLFFRPENDGDQGPIVFRWFLAPDSHGKSPHWSPPVLRLAAAIAAPLARSRSLSGSCSAMLPVVPQSHAWG